MKAHWPGQDPQPLPVTPLSSNQCLPSRLCKSFSPTGSVPEPGEWAVHVCSHCAGRFLLCVSATVALHPHSHPPSALVTPRAPTPSSAQGLAPCAFLKDSLQGSERRATLPNFNHHWVPPSSVCSPQPTRLTAELICDNESSLVKSRNSVPGVDAAGLSLFRPI